MNSLMPKSPLDHSPATAGSVAWAPVSLVSDDDMCCAEAESYRNRSAFR